MNGDLVIAVDCSTTASKAVAFNRAGFAVAMARRGYGLDHIRSGWVEQHAPDWWDATKAAIAEVTATVGADRIVGIAVTHQRETFVCLDASGAPVRPAITWMDVRATTEVDQYGTPEVHRLTGKPPNPTPAWYKLLWLGRHEPISLSKTAKVVDVGGYLINKLTGEWVTSWSSADPLGFVDLNRFDYDDRLLSAVGLSRDQVSRLLPPGTIAGGLTSAAASALGLPVGLPVVVGAGDGQSAGLGCDVTRPGRAYFNIGTGAVSGVFADSYTHGSAFRAMGGPLPGKYILETFIGGGTQNVVWFIETLGSDVAIDPAGRTVEARLEAEAAGVEPGAGGLLSLPYWSGAMTPYWDGRARGAFVGLTGLHTRAYLYRAMLEGIALEQRLLTLGVEGATGQAIEEIVLLGGGAKSPLWRQIIADVLGRPVKLAREPESTALGAGIHAAAALGLHSDPLSAARAMTGIEQVHEPDPTAHQRYLELFNAYVGVYPGLKTTFQRIAEAQP